MRFWLLFMACINTNVTGQQQQKKAIMTIIMVITPKTIQPLSNKIFYIKIK